MKLIQYRQHDHNNYIYFWVNSDEETVSPIFNDPESANKWYGEQVWKMKKEYKESHD